MGTVVGIDVPIVVQHHTALCLELAIVMLQVTNVHIVVEHFHQIQQQLAHLM